MIFWLQFLQDSLFQFHLVPLHLGVPHNQEKAVKCYEAASQAGHWRAPHVLAVAHQTGNGTPRNCTRAAQLLQVGPCTSCIH